MKKHEKTLRKLDDCPTFTIINYLWFDDYVWMFGIIITYYYEEDYASRDKET